MALSLPDPQLLALPTRCCVPLTQCDGDRVPLNEAPSLDGEGRGVRLPAPLALTLLVCATVPLVEGENHPELVAQPPVGLALALPQGATVAEGSSTVAV